MSDLRTDNERVALLAAGHAVPRSGLLLCGFIEDGVERVKQTTGQPGETIVGFSQVFSTQPMFDAKIEQMVVPTVAPFVLQTARGNLLGYGPSDYMIRVSDQTSNVALKQANQIGPGQYRVTANGRIEFSPSNAGQAVTVAYRFLLSSREVEDLAQEQGTTSTGFVVGQPNDRVMVLGGHRQIFTREFDKNADFSTGKLRAGPDGQVITSGTGTDLSGTMRIIRMPDGQDGTLGLAISLMI